MGKNSKRRTEDFDSEEVASRDENGNGANGESHEDPNLDPYLTVVDELRNQLLVSHKSMKKVHEFYKQQKVDIQNAVTNRQKLDEIKKRYQDLKITVSTLREHEKEKDEDLAKRIEVIKERETELDKIKEKSASYQVELENEREAFEKKMEKEKEAFKKRVEKEREAFDKKTKETEAAQKTKLQDQKTKIEKEQDEKYKKRVETLEKETKAQKDNDSKQISELKAKNDDLLQKLEEQKSILKEAEVKRKDAEKLKIVYEQEGEKLKEDLEKATNEFGLDARTTEFYNQQFGKIHQEVQNIATQYFKELQIEDLNALHDEIEKVDKNFEIVPLSGSEISEKLRIVHAQRVISAHLRNCIWQPFSSETTLQDEKYVSLFNQISNGLVEFYGKGGGLRAARLCTALSMRGLQYQPSAESSTEQSSLVSGSSAPLPGRAEIFTEKVMSVLSLLVEPSLRPKLRDSLFDLAKSAIAVWQIAQTDEREVVVYATIDAESLGERPDDISPYSTDGVIVLFPRITATSCSRITDLRTMNVPGTFEEAEPELNVQETCIYEGAGLPEWSPLVEQGEEEEDERREVEDEKKREELKRFHEEEAKKLKNPGMSRRKLSQSRKPSMTGSVSKASEELVV